MRRQEIRLLALLLLVLVIGVGPAGADTERRVALVIGNDSYISLGNLKNAGNDASAMAAKLKALGFVSAPVLRNADRSTILKALRSFRESATGADLALVFYAGHGIQSRGENYLLPADIDIADEVDLPDAAISLHGLVDQLQAGGVRRSLIIWDACRDNPLAKRFADTARNAGRSSGVGRGLAVVEKTPPETVVWFSSEAGQIAGDGDGRNSPFTGALLAALDKPGLTTDDVFRHVVKEVRGQSPRPYGLFSDPVYFRPGTAKAPAEAAPAAASSAAPAPLADSNNDGLFWQSIKDSKDPDDYQSYLQQFPNGTFADLARKRIEKAKGAETAALAPPPPGVLLEARDQEMVAGRKASVREVPNPKAKVVATLKEGDSVQVTGKVKGENWYAIERKGLPQGYVVTDTLEEPEAYKARKIRQASAVPAAPPVKALPPPATPEGEVKALAQQARGGALAAQTRAREAQRQGIAVGQLVQSGYGVDVQSSLRYEGEFRDGKRNGYGVLTFTNGERYEGVWRDDKRNGYGVNSFANGQRYEGEGSDDKRNGYGVYIWPSGIRYEGEQRGDKINGRGVMTYPDGRVEAGIWRDETFIQAFGVAGGR